MTNSWVNLEYFEWDSSGVADREPTYSEWVFIPEVTKETTFWDLVEQSTSLEKAVTPDCYGVIFYRYLNPKSIRVQVRPQGGTWMVTSTFLPERSSRVGFGDPASTLSSVLPDVKTLKRFGVSYYGDHGSRYRAKG